MTEQPPPSCPNCGTPTPAGATFCPNCGRSLAQPQSVPFSRQSLAPQEARTWAMGAHISALGTALLGGVSSFIGPLVVWLIRRDSDPFVAEHAREALNFNVTIDAIVIVSLVLGVLTLGLGFLILGPLLLVVGVLWLVFTIQAASAASNGETYRYPFSVRLVN